MGGGRQTRVGAQDSVVHALGDAVSPTLIGSLSDAFNLKAALFAAAAFLGLAAALCFWGMASLDRVDSPARF